MPTSTDMAFPEIPRDFWKCLISSITHIMQGFILQTFINFEKCKLMPFKGCAETP